MRFPPSAHRDKLIERLRRIEALFLGASSEGERTAAAEARKRVKARLDSLTPDPGFTVHDLWSLVMANLG